MIDPVEYDRRREDARQVMADLRAERVDENTAECMQHDASMFMEAITEGLNELSEDEQARLRLALFKKDPAALEIIHNVVWEYIRWYQDDVTE